MIRVYNTFQSYKNSEHNLAKGILVAQELFKLDTYQLLSHPYER